MDKIILLINKITPSDALLMQDCFIAAQKRQEALQAAGMLQPEEIKREISQQLEQTFPPSVLALYKAIKVLDNALMNLARYNRDEKGKAIHKSPLRNLDQVELHEIMFGRESIPKSQEPLVVNLLQAIHRFLKNDAAGYQFILDRTQDTMTPMMISTISLDQEQLHKALTCIRQLQENCDFAPLNFDESLKIWLVNSESYSFAALMEGLNIQPGASESDRIRNKVEEEQASFGAQVEKEYQASHELKDAKRACEKYLQSLKKELVEQLKKDKVFIKLLKTSGNKSKLSKSEIENGINAYIKLLARDDLPIFEADKKLEKQYHVMCYFVRLLDSSALSPTEKVSEFHEKLNEHAGTIASGNNAGEKFKAAIGKFLKACHLPVPEALKTKGERLISKVSRKSMFRPKETETHSAPSAIDKKQRDFKS